MADERYQDVAGVFGSHIYLCVQCRQMFLLSGGVETDGATLLVPSDDDINNDDSLHHSSISLNGRYCCALCLGLRQENLHEDLQQQLQQAVTAACEDYGGISSNGWSVQHSPPTVSLSGDFSLRYNTILQYLSSSSSESLSPNGTATKTTTTTKGSITPVAIFLHQLKEHVRLQLPNECLSENTTLFKTFSNKKDDAVEHHDPSSVIVLNEEEQGYLCVHVSVVPTNERVQRPRNTTLLAPSRKRQRYRGPQQLQPSQGGDPRTNLEHRLRQPQDHGSKSLVWWSAAEADHAFQQLLQNISNEKQHGNNTSNTSNNGTVQQKSIIDTSWLPVTSTDNPLSTDEAPSSPSLSSTSSCVAVGGSAFQIHVAVWRRPFFVQGCYTKHRRDVSQSPFFVGSKRLGITSVEEEIVTVLTRHVGGISTHNNNNNNDNNSDQQQQQRVVFGMVKFHASGREDLDVRMLLPPPNVGCFGGKEEKDNLPGRRHDDNDERRLGGRPFVCQVVDALRMPTKQDLQQVVHEINHDKIPSDHQQNGNNSDPRQDAPDQNESLAGDASQEAGCRYYGHNPKGVGIAPLFDFCPADCFKNLQKETEEKVKYYGCLCWSQDEVDSQETLDRKLGIMTTTSAAATAAAGGGAEESSIMPSLELQQRTPIRVLHRRVNVVRHRRVLAMQAQRIDAHFFRLYLSTEAGTYIKEFVHGDLGRTRPSVSSLLQCKTDIMELDCLGMQLSGSE